MILLEVTHSLTSALTVCLVGGREREQEREKEHTSLFWSRASCSEWARLHNSGTPCRKRTQTGASDISNRYFFIYSALQNCQVADCEIWLRSSSFWGNKFPIRGRPLQVKIGWCFPYLWMILDPFCILEKTWLHELLWAAWSEKVNKELGWVSKGRISALIMI